MCRVNGDRDPDGPQVHHLRAGGVSVVIAADAIDDGRAASALAALVATSQQAAADAETAP